MNIKRQLLPPIPSTTAAEDAENAEAKERPPLITSRRHPLMHPSIDSSTTAINNQRLASLRLLLEDGKGGIINEGIINAKSGP